MKTSCKAVFSGQKSLMVHLGWKAEQWTEIETKMWTFSLLWVLRQEAQTDPGGKWICDGRDTHCCLCKTKHTHTITDHDGSQTWDGGFQPKYMDAKNVKGFIQATGDTEGLTLKTAVSQVGLQM